MKKIYDKLVRDKILKKLKEGGIGYGYHIATDEEILEKLYKKLDEEIQEFKENPSVEELADMLEVLEAIGKFHHISLNEITKYKKTKKLMAGGFENNIILEWTKE